MQTAALIPTWVLLHQIQHLVNAIGVHLCRKRACWAELYSDYAQSWWVLGTRVTGDLWWQRTRWRCSFQVPSLNMDALLDFSECVADSPEFRWAAFARLVVAWLLPQFSCVVLLFRRNLDRCEEDVSLLQTQLDKVRDWLSPGTKPCLKWPRYAPLLSKWSSSTHFNRNLGTQSL